MRNSESNRSEKKPEHLKAVAKEAGVKLTHQRLEIFRELAGTEEQPDAETILRAVQQRMPTVSLGLVSTLGKRRQSRTETQPPGRSEQPKRRARHE